jgi:hypothetical protein
MNETEAKEAWSSAFKDTMSAQNDAENALRKAIDAKLREIHAAARLLEAQGAKPKEVRQEFEKMRLLGRNKDHVHRFVDEALDVSWRKRVLGL